MFNLEKSRLEAARKLVRHIADLLQADLSVELWNGEVLPLGPGARDDIKFIVRSPRAIKRLLLHPGLMTLFELYAEGEFEITGGSPLEASRRIDHPRTRRLAKLVDRKLVAKCAVPFLFMSKKSGDNAAYDKTIDPHYARARDDKELIQFHYDVSNAFFGLFLDPEMVYSSAYFLTPETSLEHAQITKLDRICQKLRLAPGDRLLDIGCGWGGLICHAAQNFGATCHGVTLSQKQFDFATAKIARLGLGDRIKLELRDYRSVDTPAAYDKIAQIEMFEHVGLENHDRHFAHMNKLLRPRGLYLHQASTRLATADLSQFRKVTSYSKVIDRFIFPGGECDYIGLTATNLERHGFEVHDVEAMREHFQKTLEIWVARLYEHRQAASTEVGWTRTRLWLLYMSMCARAFERSAIGVFQTVASKRHAGPSGLPLARGE